MDERSLENISFGKLDHRDVCAESSVGCRRMSMMDLERLRLRGVSDEYQKGSFGFAQDKFWAVDGGFEGGGESQKLEIRK